MRNILTTIAALCIFATSYGQLTTKVQPGDKAPDLAFNNPEGKLLRLSEINKGRYVLLDFWASWCRPCRGANPGLVKLYKEYSAKKFKNAKNGFTVVSVSLDQEKTRWVQAMTVDGLNWPFHMSDLAGWQSKAAEIYGIQSIPQCLLIGPDGKIINQYQIAEQAVNDLNRFTAN
jgi:thiol-disulfide isomerase/thioredoxin